jgi:hypothetical protein
MRHAALVIDAQRAHYYELPGSRWCVILFSIAARAALR